MCDSRRHIIKKRRGKNRHLDNWKSAVGEILLKMNTKKEIGLDIFLQKIS